MNIEADASGGFKKLNFLLANPPFPPETFPEPYSPILQILTL
jgi:tetratricopeptide repeat protein 30